MGAVSADRVGQVEASGAGVNPAEMSDIKAKAADRKRRRKSNAEFQAQVACKPIRPTKSFMIAQADRLWSLIILRRDRKAHAGRCVICRVRPADVAYHIVPKQRGHHVRWLLENGCASCSDCNFGEVMNRSMYRSKHISIFGRDLVERIEDMPRKKFSLQDLIAERDKLKAVLEGT